MTEDTPISNTRLLVARILSGLPALFLIADGGMKLFKPAVVVETSAQLGYPESTLVGIGLALVASTLLYLVPRTSVLGAIFLTGYLGGAVATHVGLAHRCSTSCSRSSSERCSGAAFGCETAVCAVCCP